MTDASGPGRPYLIVSTDGHVSPSPGQLRKFCPPGYLAEFDAFTAANEAEIADNRQTRPPAASDKFWRTKRRMLDAPGIAHPAERIVVMDADGIAAEVLFAGAGGKQKVPLVGSGHNAGNRSQGDTLIAVGASIWNEGMAEYCAHDPARLLGVMQVPIGDIPAAVAEVRRGHAAGLRIMNLPAPRSDFPPYTRPVYEPLWEACEELGITLTTHSGGGERPLGSDEPMGYALIAMETHWLSRRNIWQLIFGGVFERHPGLRLVVAEQRANWITETVRDMDSAYSADLEYHLVGSGGAGGAPWFERAPITRQPSEYWDSSVFVGASFLARFEAARYADFGMQNLMWGTDFPHMEGTWPVTPLALRNTFAGIPEPAARRILGETALRAYSLDEARLREIADRIGPKPAEVAQPLGPGEDVPENRSMAFREFGSFL